MAVERTARKRQRVSHDDDDGKKTRGRPRVEGQDETAADRRRTQIRLAQRAYRLRKETTISSLKAQVSALQSTIEEMNKTFLHFNDRAVASGVLQMSPELGRELKAATEHFILLAKASNSSGDEHSDSEMEEIPRKSSKKSPRDVEMTLDHQNSFSHSASSMSPEPRSATQSGVDIGLGYVQIFDDMPSEVANASVQVPTRSYSTMQMDNSNSSALERYDGAMENFGLFQYSAPSTTSVMMAVAVPNDSQYQQYNVQVPSPSSINMAPLNKSLPPDYTYSFQEITFARRLQRAALERGFHLLSNAEQRPHAYERVFRLSLLYHTRENLLAKFRAALSKPVNQVLETYQTPFIHLGGAGTHYRTGRVQNGYIVKPGPLIRQATLESADTPGISHDIDLDLSEYEGEWFDSNDVEGYLESKGLHIDPQSTFVEGQIEAKIANSSPGSPSPADIFSSPSPSASGFGTGTSLGTTPPTPTAMKEKVSIDLTSERGFPELGVWDNGTNWDTTAAGWLMGSGDKTPDFLNSGWLGVDNPAPWDYSDAVGASDFENFGATHLANASVVKDPEVKKMVTIDVSKLIDELIKTAICLGRAPGFRKRDLDRALTSSIIQVF